MQTTISLLEMKKILIILPLLVYFHSASSQNYEGSKEQINLILSNISKFSEAVVNSDYEKIGNSYTEDAKIFPNNTKIIEGREAIIDYWRLPDGVQITYHKVTPIEIKIIGKEAYDYGYYEGATKRTGSEVSSWKGKYVIIWRKTDGAWKIYLDIWNRVAD
jgi:ketosteroid isomerase-like protein